MYLLYRLKSYGLTTDKLQILFRALVLSKLLYASQAWWGLLIKSELTAVDKLLKRAKNGGYYDKTAPMCIDLFDGADLTLLNNIISNANHCLQKYLPPLKHHKYLLRPRSHGFIVPFTRSQILKNTYFYRVLSKK
jgi:hypothetical protein